MTIARVLTIFSAVAFLGYGIVCVCSKSMVGDFRRFGLEHLRILTGVLEIIAGMGLLIGLRWTPVLLLSSGGLALLMFIAFCIRLHMRDSVAASLPSLLFALLNSYILGRALQVFR